MTFGGIEPVMRQNLVRVQKKGQVTLPATIRQRLGIKKGDLVAFEETSGGILITTQELMATQALDIIGAALREQGIDLDDLIESGRSERNDLLSERYELEIAQ